MQNYYRLWDHVAKLCNVMGSKLKMAKLYMITPLFQKNEVKLLINRKWSTKSLSSGTSGFTACDCDLLPKLITIW